MFSSGKGHSGDLSLPAKAAMAVLVVAVVAASALAYVSAEDGDATYRYDLTYSVLGHQQHDVLTVEMDDDGGVRMWIGNEEIDPESSGVSLLAPPGSEPSGEGVFTDGSTTVTVQRYHSENGGAAVDVYVPADGGHIAYRLTVDYGGGSWADAVLSGWSVVA